MGGQAYADGWDRIFKKPDGLDPTDDSPCPENCPMCQDASAPYDQDLREQVEDFHVAFGQPILDVPTVPDTDRVMLRLRLIAEEFFELLEACDVDHGMYYDPSRICPMSRVNLVEVADALGDLDYVIEGTRLEFGINGGPVAAEIHRSNMSKLVDGKPLYREDGKVAKGPNYSPPDIEGELRKQGWNGA